MPQRYDTATNDEESAEIYVDDFGSYFSQIFPDEEVSASTSAAAAITQLPHVEVEVTSEGTDAPSWPDDGDTVNTVHTVNVPDRELTDDDDAPPSSQASTSSVISAKHRNIVKIRETVNANQCKAAVAMLSRSAQLLGTVSVGDNVILFVSEFDKGLSDAPYLLCKVIEIEKSAYRLASEVGILNNLFHRNAFMVGSVNIDYPTMNTLKTVSIREAVTALSLGTGQGVIRCDCTQTCQRKCTCKKYNLKCKSRCHKANGQCQNK